MAKFEYRCSGCGQLTEEEFAVGMALGKITEFCPVCQLNIAKHRIFSPIGLVFKGNGWGGKPDKKYPPNTVSLEEAKSIARYPEAVEQSVKVNSIG